MTEVQPGVIVDEVAFIPEDKIQETSQPGEPVSPELNDQLNQFFQTAKKISTVEGKSKTLVFVAKGRGVAFNIDRTSLEPKLHITARGGSFKERYVQHLENILFNSGEKANPNELIPLMMLVDVFKKGHSVVKLTSGKYVSTLAVIAEALTSFYADNQAVLEAMYKMFNDATHIPDKQSEVERE